MATKVGTWLGGKWTTAGGSVFQAGIELYLDSQAASTCTYHWRTFVYVSTGDFEGSVGYCETSCNGTYGVTLYTGPSWPGIVDSSTFSASRGSTITCSNYTWYQRTSGRAESTANASYTVPSRTPHGTPTFTASASSVGANEEVTLTIQPSATQGSANFDHFEISDGNSNYFFISPSTTTAATVTTTDVPSAVLEKYGAQEYYEAVKRGSSNSANEVFDVQVSRVYYAAREVHEWYGTYPASAWVWVEVEVVYLDMTLYDSRGDPHKVVKITVYDSEGNALSGTSTAYDRDGNQL